MEAIEEEDVDDGVNNTCLLIVSIQKNVNTVVLWHSQSAQTSDSIWSIN